MGCYNNNLNNEEIDDWKINWIKANIYAKMLNQSIMVR